MSISEKNVKRYVISSIQNDSSINQEFFDTLKSFTTRKSAKLMLLPTKYMGDKSSATWDKSLQKYIVNAEVEIGSNIKVLGDLYLLATLDNPISGFDTISKGKTVIVGHAQYQMKFLTSSDTTRPIMLTSTGSVTVPNVNANTKVGKKAIFNHSFSALYLSVVNEGQPNEEFHIRNLNWDGAGFYDVDGYYSGQNKFQGAKIEAIVTGDEHVSEISKDVFECTYGKNGIVETLRPNYIIRHDVLDFNSASHHAKGKLVIQNNLERDGTNDIKKELDETASFILQTTPKDTKTFIVASNHNEHLDRWLEDPDSNLDKKNAKLYHWLMLEKYKPENAEFNAFEIYFRYQFKDTDRVLFLDRNDPEYIYDIEVHQHGDKAGNGVRGSIQLFSKHTQKTIIGHSHTPGVDKGCYQVGTSSKLRMSYNSGMSSWGNSHVLIYNNGKRQHIHIVNGKWFV